jgi:ADP-ribose pyrophosphatase
VKHAIEVIAREVCFDGFLRVARYCLRHRLFAGGWSGAIYRERVEPMHAAAAILYDPLSDQVVMVEQFRIGVLELGAAAWTLEPVGGVIHPGEDPAQVVRREAMEEAGCAIVDLIPIGTVQISPGIAAQRLDLYCGRVSAADAGGVFGLRHEGEETRVTVFDLEQALTTLFASGLDNSAAIISLQWLALNRGALRARWGIEPSAY